MGCLWAMGSTTKTVRKLARLGEKKKYGVNQRMPKEKTITVREETYERFQRFLSALREERSAPLISEDDYLTLILDDIERRRKSP
jgi:hypothetical protein